MKTKILLIVTIALLSFTNIFAQNTTMAKAFYKKAQKAYAKKEYKDVITHIEKTKEHLGSTNPDIIYLEAKARLENDLNITKTKELLNQFMNDAPEDSRIEEVAGILADIETSDDYYSSGLKKKRTYTLKDGRIRTLYYSELYEETNSYNDEYIYNDENKTKEVIYTVGGLTNFRETYKYGGIFTQTLFYGYDSGEKSMNTKSYCRVYFVEKNQKKVKVKILQSGGRNGLEKERFVNLYLSEKASNIFYYINNNKIAQLYSERTGSFKAYKTTGETYLNFDRNTLIVSYYKIEDKYLPFSKYYPNKMIKVLKVPLYKGYNLYYFTEDGIPEKKEYYKKGRLKTTFIFNIKSENWIEQ